MATKWSWVQEAGPTVFAPFPSDTDYFGRMDQQSMLNFRVRNLDAMLAQLSATGAVVEEQVSEASYGRFGHAVDRKAIASSSGSRGRFHKRSHWR